MLRKQMLHNLAGRLSLPIILFAVFGWAGNASAGIIFTNQAAFNTAVAGLSVVGTENFDALNAGPVSNPDTFMAGLIEIGDTNPLINTGICLSCPNEWVGNVGTSSNPVTITGPGGGAMGFGAFALPNRKEFNGTWSFLTSIGLDTLAQSLNFSYSFLGWVGSGSETLVSISYNTGGIALDDLVAYSSVPEPTTLALLGLGLFGLGFNRRKRT